MIAESHGILEYLAEFRTAQPFLQTLKTLPITLSAMVFTMIPLPFSKQFQPVRPVKLCIYRRGPTERLALSILVDLRQFAGQGRAKQRSSIMEPAIFSIWFPVPFHGRQPTL